MKLAYFIKPDLFLTRRSRYEFMILSPPVSKVDIVKKMVGFLILAGSLLGGRIVLKVKGSKHWLKLVNNELSTS